MAKIKCDHCQLKFEEDSLINDENGGKFCCNGCKQVFHLLHADGLDEFYTKLGKNSLNPAKIREISKEETAGIYNNFVTINSDGFSEIFIIIEGIHCSACVWLNEKVLFNTDGIIEANISASTHKAKIVWDDDKINLAEIFTKIMAIGYNPYPYDPATAETRINTQKRAFYSRLMVGIFSVMNIMWIAIALYSGYFSGMEQGVKDIMHFAEFILATPVLFFTGSVFFKGSYYAIKNKNPNMDLLVCSGATLIYIYSLYAMFSRKGEVYFDSVAMIITFVFIGKYLEILSKKRAVDSLDKLSSMVVGEVLVKNGDKFVSKNPNEVAKDDIILVNSGQKVMIDGEILSGNGSFDYASLSGESLPVYHQAGDSITSGAVCIDGSIEYRAVSNFKGSILSKIIDLLENASLKKPKIELLVNEISAKFSITILTLAFFTFLAWVYFSEFDKAVIVSVSVLIIACPCALGLATPVATLVGLATGLKRGVIFKEAKIIESIAKCHAVVFDKTGTLTKANLAVFDSYIDENLDRQILLSLLKSSNHPISKAVLNSLNLKSENLELKDIKDIPAKGLSATYNNQKIIGGSARFMNENGINVEAGNSSEYFFAINGKIMANFKLKDSLRDDAKSALDEIRALGLEIHMISGDNENAAKNIADELCIKNYKSGVLPTEKVEYIEELIKNGKNVIMVGDGINDAPALGLASVGISLGGGADVAIANSDVVLLRDDLKSVVLAVNISKSVYKTIKQNLAISLIYNLLTIPLAICGLIIPLIAAISMSLSSVLVVLNSMKIKRIINE